MIIYDSAKHVYYEYLLMITPSYGTAKSMIEIKQIFSNDFGCRFAANLHPHITMVNFIQPFTAEPKVFQWFKNHASYVNAIHVDLKDFGKFDSHTIYVKINDHKEIVELVNNIRRNFAAKLNVANLKPIFVSHPHLTIARGMTSDQFNIAWNAWEKKTYNESFTATNMVLIKRPYDIFKGVSIGNYKKVSEFDFEGKNIYGRQTSMLIS